MNKERYNQIIDEAYNYYLFNSKYFPFSSVNDGFIGTKIDSGKIITENLFINKIKTDIEFSEKWGLKIEERELSLDERMKIWQNQQDGRGYFIMELLDNIPTKLITLTYNNETIESYD